MSDIESLRLGHAQQESTVQQAQSLSTTDPYLARFHHSVLLHGDLNTEFIATRVIEKYGQSDQPISFAIGNGGAGYTGLLRLLSERYIDTHGNDFCIAWVANHSRHSQLALLADVVQVALTYEPHNEDVAIAEGWARRVCRAFTDHFILAGPSSDPAGVLTSGGGVVDAFKAIAEYARHADESSRMAIFHTRGDGSATYHKEVQLWTAAGVDPLACDVWLHTVANTPYNALKEAESTGAYLLSDRSTYLTAKRDGAIPHLRVLTEGGQMLLNPCSALINTAVPMQASHRNAMDFAGWLGGEEARGLIKRYGLDWEHGMPLFSVAGQDEFTADYCLAHRL